MNGTSTILPSNFEAETAVLGSMVLDASVIPLVRSIIVGGANDFYTPTHGIIFRVIVALHESGVEPDAVSIVSMLRDGGDLEAVGGVDGMLQIIEGVPTATSAHHYAKLVREKAVARRNLAVLDQLQRDAAAGTLTPDELVRAARERLIADAPRITPSNLGDIMRIHHSLADPIVPGLFRRGEVMTLIGASKSRKSWAVLNLAMAMAADGEDRREWLGIPIPLGRVLLVDLELAGATIAHRSRTIQESLGLSLARFGDRLRILTLRGERFDIDHFERDVREWGEADLIIVDPLYRTYPEKYDENSNADAARLYGRFAGIAAESGAGLVLVHHLAKGSAAGKAVVDQGAGAGAMARAGDVHAVLKPNEANPDSATFECVVRSFKPMAPIPLVWERGVWRVNPDGIATRDNWTPEAFAERIVTGTLSRRESIIERATRQGLTTRDANRLFQEALDAGILDEEKQGRARRYRSTDIYAHANKCAQIQPPGVGTECPSRRVDESAHENENNPTGEGRR